MVSISLLTLVAIGLLVARESTGSEEFLYGAYGALVIVAVASVIHAATSRLGDVEDLDEVGPSTDDIDRILAYNVAPSITAKSVIEHAAAPESEPLSVPVSVPVRVPVGMFVETPVPLVEPAQIAGPVMLSPSTEVFVNIGRRNKQLNRQMLTLISHLERDELNPEVLHGLYELDHLATRMRRNEETLLLLASTRRVRQWSPPVTLENVLRSALAEVERFSRVEIDEVPDVEVLGEAVSDITHLLAELIDNATEFSHASTVVTVSAHTTLEGIEIEVLDAGHGIDQAKLDLLNELLAEPPKVDDAPSRRLGLFIAAQIADGMPIDVALTGERGVGTVATVSVDNELLVEVEDVEHDEATLDALDLLDPVMQLAVGAQLDQDEEEELAMAALPSEEDVAEVLATLPTTTEKELPQSSFPTVFFPTIGPVDEPPELPTLAVDFPSVPVLDVIHAAQPLPSRIPQATFESVWGDESLAPMPFPEVVTQPPTSDPIAAGFDDESARTVAYGAGSSVAAFTGGVARGMTEAEDEIAPISPDESPDS